MHLVFPVVLMSQKPSLKKGINWLWVSKKFLRLCWVKRRKCCLTMDNKSMMKRLFRQWRFKPSQKWLSMVSKLHQHKAWLWWELFQRHAGLQLSGDANDYLQFLKKYRLKVWLAEFMTHMFLANNFLHLQRPLLISPCSSSPCSYMMEFRTWLYCCIDSHVALKPIVESIIGNTANKLGAFKLSDDQWSLAHELSEVLSVGELFKKL